MHGVALLVVDPRGRPQRPADIARHECLTLSSEASQTRGWAFTVEGQLTHVRPTSRFDCSDGQVLHAWCLAGLGLAWRSWWEVEADVRKLAALEALSRYGRAQPKMLGSINLTPASFSVKNASFSWKTCSTSTVSP